MRKIISGIQVVAFYAQRPMRLGEIPRWLFQRNRSTLDMRKPWWNYAAIELIESRLRRGYKVFEYGGGGSTLWLADHGCGTTTVEHDPAWFDLLINKLPSECNVLHHSKTSHGAIKCPGEPDGYFDTYVDSISRYPDNSFDLVIIDGRARVDCIRASLGKVRPQGTILLDDSQREIYADAFQLLENWPAITTRGAKPGGGGLVQTTIWIKPRQ